MFEEQHSQRRQSHDQGVGMPMGGNRLGRQAAEISHPTAAVGRGIAVQQLFPIASVRDANSILLARHRCEIADDGNTLRR